MCWFKKIINENKIKIIYIIFTCIIFMLAILFWHYYLDKSFVWIKIKPLTTPPFEYRILYSFLVYGTFGAFLYEIKFYRLLYNIFVKNLRSWELFKIIKGSIWASLIIAMYFTVAVIINFLNMLISLFYNTSMLTLYLLPSIGATLVLLVIFIYYDKKKGILKKYR